jgi:hypothetical protein
MLDLNNRPAGPNLIVTAKTAHKVHFLDAETLTISKTIDMPGSTHELFRGRAHRVWDGLWRGHFREKRQPRPAPCGDRSAVAIADACDRPR